METIPSKSVKVASIQCSSLMGKTSENIKKLIPLIREAALQGAKIIVLPETSITGYLSQDLKTNWRSSSLALKDENFPFDFPFQLNPSFHAETCPGATTEIFGKLSKELQVYITVPFLEKEWKNGEELYYNTVCLMNKDGNIVAHYRKNNPWPSPEKFWATKGEDLAVYERLAANRSVDHRTRTWRLANLLHIR